MDVLGQVTDRFGELGVATRQFLELPSLLECPIGQFLSVLGVSRLTRRVLVAEGAMEAGMRPVVPELVLAQSATFSVDR